MPSEQTACILCSRNCGLAVETDGVLGVFTLTRRHGTGKQAREGVLKLHLDDGSIDWRQWDAGQRHAFFTLTDWRNYGMRLEDHFAVGDGGDLTLGFEMERYGGRSREVRPASTLSFGDFRFGNTEIGRAHV